MDRIAFKLLPEVRMAASFYAALVRLEGEFFERILLGDVEFRDIFHSRPGEQKVWLATFGVSKPSYEIWEIDRARRTVRISESREGVVEGFVDDGRKLRLVVWKDRMSQNQEIPPLEDASYLVGGIPEPAGPDFDVAFTQFRACTTSGLTLARAESNRVEVPEVEVSVVFNHRYGRTTFVIPEARDGTMGFRVAARFYGEEPLTPRSTDWFAGLCVAIMPNDESCAITLVGPGEHQPRTIDAPLLPVE